MDSALPTAPAATGGSRSSLAAYRARTLADGFSGLPPGITRWRLAAAVRTAATRLALTPSMLSLIAHYIDLTYDVDWEAGSEPVIGWSVIEVAEALGKSERQIRNLERGLMERGLLAWRDSGNQHRRASRDRAGRLRYAYGPTLAPLGRRAAEIIGLADTARAERARIRQIRLSIAALRRRLKSDIIAIHGGDTETARDMLHDLRGRLPAHMGLEALEAVRATLSAQLDAMPRDGMAATGTPEITESAGMPAISCRPIPDTEHKHCIKVTARPVSAGEAWTAAGGMIGTLCPAGDRTWPALWDAARQALPMLGLTEDDWGRACHEMGRNGASQAVIILEAGMMRDGSDPHPAITKPRQYLRALGRRHARGDLALERSIRGLIARRQRTATAAKPPPGLQAGPDGANRPGQRDSGRSMLHPLRACGEPIEKISSSSHDQGHHIGRYR